MQSSKSVAPNQLAATFGAQAAQCLEQEGSRVSYVPKRTVLQISCPVNFVSYVERNELVPVQTQTEYRAVQMQPQRQQQNSPCRPPAAAPMVPVQQEQSDCGNCGSCSQGPYNPSPPIMAAQQASPCGGGYAGVLPGGAGSQMMYAPPPQGVASYQAGMYSANAQEGAMGYAGLY